MVRTYVEKLLRQLINDDQLQADPDGDYPVRYRDALYFVRIDGDASPLVRVFSIALDDVQLTPELLAEVNDINTKLTFARAMFVRGQVLIETELLGEDLAPRSFGAACQSVAVAADRFAPELADRHGGRLAFHEAKSEDYQAEPPVGYYP